MTSKVKRDAFKVVQGQTKEHVSDNGVGKQLHREFCPTCGSGILEWAVSDTLTSTPRAPDSAKA